MYTQDKIINGGEIVDAGKFTKNGHPFYICMIPKDADSPSGLVLSGEFLFAENESQIPLNAGVWNPVVLKSLTVSSSDLSLFRIFWGTEK